MRRGALVAAGLVLAGCSSAAPGGGAAEPGPSSPAPVPPAACLLDTAALETATGVAWTADAATATDTRCVYDPAGDPPGAGAAFVTVSLEGRTDADVEAELGTLAQPCASGSRSPVDAAEGGFVCRIGKGTAYAAAVRGDRVVTVTSSAAPEGTTTAKLAAGFGDQLPRLLP